jgi:hypothetical protein
MCRKCKGSIIPQIHDTHFGSIALTANSFAAIKGELQIYKPQASQALQMAKQCGDTLFQAHRKRAM